MPPTRSRIPIIDLVRFVSILAVIATHLNFARIAASPQNRWIAAAWRYAAQNGFYGVTMFFVVSGFVITRTLTSRAPDFASLDLRAFYIRRAGRILPLFLVVVAVGVVGLHRTSPDSFRTALCFRGPGARFDAWFWVSLATFSFNWLRVTREHGTGFGLHWDVLWSLAIEEQFYLVYPLLLAKLRSRRRVAFFLIGVIVLGPLARLGPILLWPDRPLLSLTSSFACFDLIAMGALLALVLERQYPIVGTARGRGIERTIGCLGAALVAAIYCWVSPAGIACAWSPSAIGLGLCAFLAVGVRRGWCDSRGVGWLTYPGQLSYGGYVLHATMLFLLWPVLGRYNVWLDFVLYASATLLLAAVVYRYFEVPTNQRVRRRYAAD